MAQEEVLRRTDEYVAMLVKTFEKPYSIEMGRRYIKVNGISYGRSVVHTFIDLENGDILKAATYKAPQKNGVRGNIFADDLGMSVVDQYGAIYLK